MLNIYLNTVENVFFDANGSLFPDNSPELSVGGKEEIHFFLKENVGEEPLNPTAWPTDTSWGTLPGISAMVTVDDDYRKYTKGSLATALSGGENSITAAFPTADVEDIPLTGALRIFSADGAIENIAYSARSVNGGDVTFAIEGAVGGIYAEGVTVDCTTSPLAQAYLAADKSNWESGELVFNLVLDSARLRAENDYRDQAGVAINGLELLLYSVNDGEVQILRSFLLDTATLRNVQGNPGYNAPLPDPVADHIAAEVSRQVSAEVSRQVEAMMPILKDEMLNQGW